MEIFFGPAFGRAVGSTGVEQYELARAYELSGMALFLLCDVQS